MVSMLCVAIAVAMCTGLVMLAANVRKTRSVRTSEAYRAMLTGTSYTPPLAPKRLSVLTMVGG